MIDFGITRTVFLLGGLAIKVPQTSYGWQKFLHGMLANDQEAMWWRQTRDERLCPVLFSVPFGLLVVQRRVDRIATEADLPGEEAFSELPLDYKPSNFGFIGPRLVLLDYGS